MTLTKKRFCRDITADSSPLAKKARTHNAQDNEELIRHRLMMHVRREQLSVSTSPTSLQSLQYASASRSSSPRHDHYATAASASTSNSSISIVTPCNVPSSTEDEEVRSDEVLSLASLPRPPFEKSGNALEMLSSVSSHIANTAQAKAVSKGTVNTITPIAKKQVYPLKSCLKTPTPPPQAKTTTTSKNEENYVGCRSSSGLRHGRGIMKYPNGCRYVGHFSNNKRHGYGKVWYPNGLGIYTGYWRDNKRHGTGTMSFANGDIYEGQWMNDQPNGTGTLVMKNDNEMYSGNFVNHEKDGVGVYKWPNGDVYKGEFRRDVRHGSGVMVFANGDVDRRVYYRGALLQYGL